MDDYSEKPRYKIHCGVLENAGLLSETHSFLCRRGWMVGKRSRKLAMGCLKGITAVRNIEGGGAGKTPEDF